MIKTILLLLSLLAGLSTSAPPVPKGSKALANLKGIELTLGQTLQTADGLVLTLLGKLTDQTGVVAVLKTSLNSIATALTSIVNSILELVKSLLGGIVTITESLVDTATDLNTALQQVNQLTDQLGAIAGTVDGLTGELTAVTNTLAGLQSQLQALAGNLPTPNLNTLVNNLVGQIGTLTINLNTLANAIGTALASLISAVLELVSQVLALVAQVLTNITRLVDLNAVLSQLTGQVGGVLNEIRVGGLTDTLNSQVADLLTGLTNVQTQLDQVSNMIATLTPQQLTQYATDITTFNQQKAVLAYAVDQLRATVNQ
jgi:chromosome segregation ATPase